MAKKQVHDMSGRSCAICGHLFTRASMNLTLKRKCAKGLIEAVRVCGKCWNNHA